MQLRIKRLGVLLMKMGIIPFREFWIDCFSTAINSIVSSKLAVPMQLIYDNNYIYKEKEVSLSTGKKIQTVVVNMQNEDVFGNNYCRV